VSLQSSSDAGKTGKTVAIHCADRVQDALPASRLVRSVKKGQKDQNGQKYFFRRHCHEKYLLRTASLNL
jgi:hypothetical protein